MAYKREDYDKANAAYKENNTVTNARSNMNAIAAAQPQYANSYANQIGNIYSQIRQGNNFNYDPQNDAAYRRYAEEYNALAGLAIAGNQAQAQQLTGGYGSTYAPDVAQQGEARLKAGVVGAQPAFMTGAQNAWQAQNDQLMNAYEAGAKARDAEIDNYKKSLDIWNNRNNLVLQQYENERDFLYNQYKDNRDYNAKRYQQSIEQQQFDRELAQKDTEFNSELELKSYDVYNKLASVKCAEYNEAQNNSGMKAYLDGLVEAGKITQYMADNLYNQYKFEASSSGGGSSGRRSSGRSSGSNGYSYGGGAGTTTTTTKSTNTNGFDKFVANHPKELQSTDAYHYNAILVREIKAAQSNGTISAQDAADLLNYYGLTGDEYKSTKTNSGGNGHSVSANKNTIQIK